MFFNTKRKRATRAAIEGTRPYLRTLGATGGVPANFWSVPYNVGWMHGIIVCVAKSATDNKINSRDLGYAVIDTYQALCPEAGVDVSKRALAWQTMQEPSFVRGVEAALKTFLVSVGAREFDDDTDVVRARRLAKSIGPSVFPEASESASVGGAMAQLLFYDVVRP